MAPTRRKLLGSIGTLSSLAIAGCVGTEGGGEGDVNTLRIGTSSTGSATYAISQGIAATVNENTDEIEAEGLPAEGSQETFGRVARGELEIGQYNNWDAALIREGMEPLSQIDFDPNKLFHIWDSQWILVAPEDRGLESVSDISSDTRVSPAQEGAGARPPLERALDHAVDDYESVNIDFAEQAGPMNEGRLDVGVVPMINASVTGSYVDEMKQTVDLRVLSWPDDVVQEINDDPLLEMVDVDMTDKEGYASAPDQASSVLLSYGWYTPNNMDADAISAFMNSLYENREGLPDYHALLQWHTEGEYWVEHPDEFPYHPAAADLYEEEGLWPDEAERGEE